MIGPSSWPASAKGVSTIPPTPYACLPDQFFGSNALRSLTPVVSLFGRSAREPIVAVNTESSASTCGPLLKATCPGKESPPVSRINGIRMDMTMLSPSVHRRWIRITLLSPAAPRIPVTPPATGTPPGPGSTADPFTVAKKSDAHAGTLKLMPNESGREG